MIGLTNLFLFLGVIVCSVCGDFRLFDQKGLIEKVNKAQTTWTAGENFEPGTKIEDILYLVGSYGFQNGEEYPDPKHLTRKDPLCKSLKLPENFDAREKWGYLCPSIKNVYNQAKCGSCWAVAAATCLTDRFCIATNGTFQGKISIQELLSCSMRKGCNGGYPFLSWTYIQKYGLVTGGEYNSNEGCIPYEIVDCVGKYSNSSKPHCSKIKTPETPRCNLKCTNKKYEKTFRQDKHNIEQWGSYGRCNAMKSIYERGSIQASFTVFEDFLTYKKGVYQYLSGRSLGGHAVRVIGWGNENGVPYWLAMNSWTKDWGDQGTFKILRGKNECRFEGNLIAGIPKV